MNKPVKPKKPSKLEAPPSKYNIVEYYLARGEQKELILIDDSLTNEFDLIEFPISSKLIEELQQLANEYNFVNYNVHVDTYIIIEGFFLKDKKQYYLDLLKYENRFKDYESKLEKYNKDMEQYVKFEREQKILKLKQKINEIENESAS